MNDHTPLFGMPASEVGPVEGSVGLRRRVVALVNPNTNADTTSVMVAIAREAAPAWLSIEGVTPVVPLISEPRAPQPRGRGGGDGDAAWLIRWRHSRGLHDPGRERLAALLGVPVVGGGRASMAAAAEPRSDSPWHHPGIRREHTALATSLGHAIPPGPVRTPPGGARRIDGRRNGHRSSLAALAREAIDDGARAIVIGGGPSLEPRVTLCRALSSRSSSRSLRPWRRSLPRSQILHSRPSMQQSDTCSYCM